MTDYSVISGSGDFEDGGDLHNAEKTFSEVIRSCLQLIVTVKHAVLQSTAGSRLQNDWYRSLYL